MIDITSFLTKFSDMRHSYDFFTLVYAQFTEKNRLKISRSRNKIVMTKLLPKNKQTNLFFYPKDLKILEIVIQVKSISDSSG